MLYAHSWESSERRNSAGPGRIRAHAAVGRSIRGRRRFSVIKKVVGQHREVAGIPAREPPFRRLTGANRTRAAHSSCGGRPWQHACIVSVRSSSCAADVHDQRALGSGSVAGSSLPKAVDVIAVGGDGDAPPLCGRMPGHLSGLRVWLPAQPALSVSCTVNGTTRERQSTTH